nr:carbohydrate sulfotransferase 14-like [Cherax quadricarinatus]
MMGRRKWWCLQWLTTLVFVCLCVTLYYNVEPPHPRMTVEEWKLPTKWILTEEVEARMTRRRHHLAQVCKETGLDQPSETNSIRSQEFLINKMFNLVWCPVYKAASSTWLWNFNLLAGYTQQHLLHDIHRPLPLARNRYPRPSEGELLRVLRMRPAVVSFMIARHPLHRLVSAYRNKIVLNRKDYSKIIKVMKAGHPELGPSGWGAWLELVPGHVGVPTFRQFVQYILEQHEAHHVLNEHWIPASQFCTPCLVNYTVLAKVETLDEDTNYIIFASGEVEQVEVRLTMEATKEV